MQCCTHLNWTHIISVIHVYRLKTEQLTLCTAQLICYRTTRPPWNTQGELSILLLTKVVEKMGWFVKGCKKLFTRYVYEVKITTNIWVAALSEYIKASPVILCWCAVDWAVVWCQIHSTCNAMWFSHTTHTIDHTNVINTELFMYCPHYSCTTCNCNYLPWTQFFLFHTIIYHTCGHSWPSEVFLVTPTSHSDWSFLILAVCSSQSLLPCATISTWLPGISLSKKNISMLWAWKTQEDLNNHI